MSNSMVCRAPKNRAQVVQFDSSVQDYYLLLFPFLSSKQTTVSSFEDGFSTPSASKWTRPLATKVNCSSRSRKNNERSGCRQSTSASKKLVRLLLVQSKINQGLCPIITLIARHVCKISSFVACLQPSIKLSRSLSPSTISAFVNGSLGGKSHPTSSSDRQNERRICISLWIHHYRMNYA